MQKRNVVDGLWVFRLINYLLIGHEAKLSLVTVMSEYFLNANRLEDIFGWNRHYFNACDAFRSYRCITRWFRIRLLITNPDINVDSLWPSTTEGHIYFCSVNCYNCSEFRFPKFVITQTYQKFCYQPILYYHYKARK